MAFFTYIIILNPVTAIEPDCFKVHHILFVLEEIPRATSLGIARKYVLI